MVAIQNITHDPILASVCCFSPEMAQLENGQPHEPSGEKAPREREKETDIESEDGGTEGLGVCVCVCVWILLQIASRLVIARGRTIGVPRRLAAAHGVPTVHLAGGQCAHCATADLPGHHAGRGAGAAVGQGAVG